MPSNFSTIGLSLDSAEVYNALDQRAMREADRARLIQTPDGWYLPWSMGGGAEAWCHFDATGQSLGFTPYFAAQSRLPVTIVERVQASALDGGFVATLTHTEGIDIPFFFDVPGYRQYDALVLPSRGWLTLAGFARQFDVFADEAALRASAKGPSMAAESFIPSGMFEPGGEKIVPPRPEGVWWGTVLAAEQRINTVTGGGFWWTRLRTLGGEIEVVVDPTLVRTPPREGNVISAWCYLVGRPERIEG